MPSFEGAECEDYDDRKAGVEQARVTIFSADAH
jgi:hypothetical protein